MIIVDAYYIYTGNNEVVIMVLPLWVTVLYLSYCSESDFSVQYEFVDGICIYIYIYLYILLLTLISYYFDQCYHLNSPK